MPTNNAGSLADEMERLRSGNESFLPELGKMNSRAAFMDKHFDTILNALRASPSVDQGVVQEDRDAAAAIASGFGCHATAEQIVAGRLDDDPSVQTLARHRHRFASPQTVGEVGQLVERLRKPDFWSAHFHGGGRLSDDDDCAPFQAADTIASLTAERDAALARCEEMRGAAENEREECAKVADAYPKKNRFGPTTRAAVSAGIASTIRARAALGEGGDQTPPNPGTTLP
jgi:hypothetical protein